MRHPRESNGTELTRDLERIKIKKIKKTRSTPRVREARQAPGSGLPGSRTFCTMLLFSNPQLLLYQELGSRGGWDGSVGSTHTERGYGTPLEPSPPSIVRWLPRTHQQDRRNANVRIVQRYVIVIRDRTSTRSNALIAIPPQNLRRMNLIELLPSTWIEERSRARRKNSLFRILIRKGTGVAFRDMIRDSYLIESRRNAE